MTKPQNSKHITQNLVPVLQVSCYKFRAVRYFVLVVAVFCITAASPAFAQNSVSSKSVIDFTWQVPIPGVSITNNDFATGDAIANYIKGIYQFLVAAAAILAMMMLVIGGVIWMTAGGNTGKVGEAQKIIGNAIAGLALALGSWVFLHTINPELVTLKAVKPSEIADISLPDVKSKSTYPNHCTTGGAQKFPVSAGGNCGMVCDEQRRSKAAGYALDSIDAISSPGGDPTKITQCCCTFVQKAAGTACGGISGSCGNGFYCDNGTCTDQKLLDADCHDVGTPTIAGWIFGEKDHSGDNECASGYCDKSTNKCAPDSARNVTPSVSGPDPIGKCCYKVYDHGAGRFTVYKAKEESGIKKSDCENGRTPAITPHGKRNLMFCKNSCGRKLSNLLGDEAWSPSTCQ